MGVKKIQIRDIVLNFKDKIAKVFGVDHTMGKVIQGKSEGIHSSGRGSETVSYNISNGLLIILDISESRRRNLLSLAILTIFFVSAKNFFWAMRVEMSFLKSFFITAQSEGRESTACDIS